jgi:hypothetical protein
MCEIQRRELRVRCGEKAVQIIRGRLPQVAKCSQRIWAGIRLSEGLIASTRTCKGTCEGDCS